MTGCRPFDKAILDAYLNSVSRSVAANLSDVNQRVESLLSGKAFPKGAPIKLTAPNVHIQKMALGCMEIIHSVEALDAVSVYLVTESDRPSPITAVQHMRYHYEHYLHEMYILHERIKYFVTIVRDSYKNDAVLTAHNAILDQLIMILGKSTKHVKKTRGQHVHGGQRFEDTDFLRLGILERIASQDKTFRPILRKALREVRKKKLAELRLNKRNIRGFTKLYFRALYPILFDKKGNIRFPQGIGRA